MKEAEDLGTTKIRLATLVDSKVGLEPFTVGILRLQCGWLLLLGPQRIRCNPVYALASGRALSSSRLVLTPLPSASSPHSASNALHETAKLPRSAQRARRRCLPRSTAKTRSRRQVADWCKEQGLFLPGATGY